MKAIRIHELKEGGIFVCTQLDVPLDDELKTALAKKNATGTLVGGGGMVYTASLTGTTPTGFTIVSSLPAKKPITRYWSAWKNCLLNILITST